MYGYFEKQRQKINLYRRYPYWNKKKVIFVHIPKVAGTSINTALYGRTLGHYTSVQIASKFPKLYQKSFVFAFTRNPWDRLFSAYNFVKSGGTEEMTVYRAEQYQVPEFETFERFVMEWLPQQNILEIDVVFRPQYLFVTDENKKINVDFVGKLESFEHGLQIISDNTGISLQVPELNVIPKKHSYADFYLPEMVDVVASTYSEDIELFNYDFA